MWDGTLKKWWINMKEFSYGIIPYLIADNGVSIMLSKSSYHDKEYGFVKGKIEPNETEEECCIREVSEEIGINLSIDDLEESIVQTNSRKDIKLYYVNWQYHISDTLHLCEREISSVKWFSVEGIPTVYKNQRNIIMKIKQRFSKLNSTMKRK
jgi:8-oxo-dGTP pyrophosphatase MutT (NUDIX family)